MKARPRGLVWTLVALAAAATSAGETAQDPAAAPTEAAANRSAGGLAGVAAGTTAAPLRLVAADSGRAMTLPPGAVLRVDLAANYSTGAEWQRRDPFGAVLESVPCEGIVREPLVTPGEPAPAVGAGTTASYCFRAASTGRAYLYLFYGRAWTPEAPAWSHFTLDVTVTPAG